MNSFGYSSPGNFGLNSDMAEMNEHIVAGKQMWGKETSGAGLKHFFTQC